MSEVRAPVEREADDALCCPRCVALDGFDEASDLRPTAGEYDLPTEVIAEPRPQRETVRTLGCYCESHDVLLPIPYSAVGDYDGLDDDLTEWLAAPIYTVAENPLVVPVRRTDMVGEST